MKLQILITHYKEKQEIVEELLESIASQKRVDWRDINVTIINDGDEVILDTTNFYKYPFRMNYLIEEHAGVSKARQTAFDKTKSDYVTWFDCDDTFYSDYDLFVILHQLDINKTADILIGQTVLESRNNFYFQRNQNWIHGYIFKRSFLVDNKIVWNEKLKIHEDWYFARLCRAITQNVKEVDIPFYLFKDAAGSVTRQEDYDKIGVPWEWITYPDKMIASEELIKNLLIRNLKLQAASYIFIQTFVPWLYMYLGEWDNDYCEERHIKETLTLQMLELWNKYTEIRKEYLSTEMINIIVNTVKISAGCKETDNNKLINKFYRYIGEKNNETTTISGTL